MFCICVLYGEPPHRILGAHQVGAQHPASLWEPSTAVTGPAAVDRGPLSSAPALTVFQYAAAENHIPSEQSSRLQGGSVIPSSQLILTSLIPGTPAHPRRESQALLGPHVSRKSRLWLSVHQEIWSPTGREASRWAWWLGIAGCPAFPKQSGDPS